MGWLAKLGDVGPGYECPAVAAQHHGLGIISGGRRECLGNTGADAVGQGVDGRVGDGNDTDGTLLFIADGIVHVLISPNSGTRQNRR